MIAVALGSVLYDSGVGQVSVSHGSRFPIMAVRCSLISASIAFLWYTATEHVLFWSSQFFGLQCHTYVSMAAAACRLGDVHHEVIATLAGSAQSNGTTPSTSDNAHAASSSGASRYTDRGKHGRNHIERKGGHGDDDGDDDQDDDGDGADDDDDCEDDGGDC